MEDEKMNQFAVPKTFQVKFLKLKKKVVLAVFVIGAVFFTLVVIGVVGQGNGAYYFVGGITAMALVFRFWNM